MRPARLLAIVLLAAAAAACGDPVDRIPAPRNQRVVTAEDQPVTFRLDAADADGDALGWAATQPAHGTLEVKGTGARYTPAPDFTGTDLVEVLASDGAHSARAYVTFEVTPVQDEPRVKPDTFPAREDEPLYLADRGLLANDLDPDGDPLTIVAVTPISGGRVALADDEVVFTPAADLYGMARFGYTVSDGHSLVEGQVVLRVGGVNDVPRLTGDVVTTDEDQPLELASATLLRNDRDPDGDSLVISEVDDPVGGRAELREDGTIVFTPAPDFHGNAGFVYRASDGFEDADAWVTVVVGVVDDLPQPGAVAVAGLEDLPVVIPTRLLLADAKDGDGDPLLVTAVGKPLQGTVVLAGDRVRFTPTPDASGAAGFRYVVSDGVHEEVGWVDITLGAVDDPPVAIGQAVLVAAGASAEVKLAGRDVDSAPLEPELLTPPAHGTLAGDSTGALRYVPEAGFRGEDALEFVVHAGGVTSAPARIVFVVAPEHTCGDGVVDPGEACDDGNALDGDGCDHVCSITACGNGILASPRVTSAKLRWLGGTCNGADAPITLAVDGAVVLSVPGGDGDCGCDEPVRTAAITDPVALAALDRTADLTVTFAGSDSHLAWAELVLDGGAARTLRLYSAGPTLRDGAWSDDLCTAPDESDVTASTTWTLGEACDDGNLVDGDGCSATCTLE